MSMVDSGELPTTAIFVPFWSAEANEFSWCV